MPLRNLIECENGGVCGSVRARVHMCVVCECVRTLVCDMCVYA